MANLGYLTRDQIITQGLQQGGNPGLATVPPGYTESIAATFLKSFLHHVYLTRDLRFMLQTATISTGTPAYEISLAGVTKFRSIKSLKLAGIKETLEIVEDYATLNNQLLADLDISPAPTGIPRKFTVAPDRSVLKLYPIPSAVYTGTITYYKLPDVTALSGSTVPDFEDVQALIQAVAMFARDYNKDTMVGLTEKIAHALFGEYRASLEDINRAKATPVRLNPFQFTYRKGD